MNRFSQINNNDQRKPKEINLKELFDVIKRRYWIILIFLAISSVVGIFYSHSSTTLLYQTSSRIIIGADEQSRKTLQVIIKDSTILDQVVKELQLERSSDALSSQITVESIDNSQVVSISVVDKDPNLAAKIADTTAKVFKNEVPKIVGKEYIRLLSNAKVNSIPINRNQNNKTLVFIIAGLVIGIGIVFFLDSLDDSLRQEQEVEALLGIPALGKVSKMNKKNIKKIKKVQLELEIRGETIGFK